MFGKSDGITIKMSFGNLKRKRYEKSNKGELSERERTVDVKMRKYYHDSQKEEYDSKSNLTTIPHHNAESIHSDLRYESKLKRSITRYDIDDYAKRFNTYCETKSEANDVIEEETIRYRKAIPLFEEVARSIKKRLAYKSPEKRERIINSYLSLDDSSAEKKIIENILDKKRLTDTSSRHSRTQQDTSIAAPSQAGSSRGR